MDIDTPADKEISVTEAASKIVVTGEVSEVVIALFERAGLLTHGVSRSDAAASGASYVNARLGVELDRTHAYGALEKKGTQLILIYDSPEQYLARVIDEGGSLDSAIDACRVYFDSILNVYRSYRRRVTLLELQAIIANPVAALDIIERRTGLMCEKSQANIPSNFTTDTNNLTALIAASVQQEDYDLRLLIKELAAGSALNRDNEQVSSTQRLLTLRHERRTNSEEAQRKAAENELLLLQLHQLQEELEHYFTQYQQSGKDLETHISQNTELEKQLETHISQNTELEKQLETRIRENTEQKNAERELLLHLHMVQEELEACVNQNTELEQGLQEHESKNTKLVTELEKEIKEQESKNSGLQVYAKYQREQLAFTSGVLEKTRETVSAMKQSKSWKLTSPLRWLLGVFLSSSD